MPPNEKPKYGIPKWFKDLLWIVTIVVAAVVYVEARLKPADGSATYNQATMGKVIMLDAVREVMKEELAELKLGQNKLYMEIKENRAMMTRHLERHAGGSP